MADLAVLSVISNNGSNKILALESDFSQDNNKFKEMLGKASNRLEKAESRKERNPEAQENKLEKTEEAQDVEVEFEFVISNEGNIKADSDENSIQSFMLSNLNTENEQFVVADDADLKKEILVASAEIDANLHQQVLPQETKVDKGTVKGTVEVDTVQELVITTNADVNSFMPIKFEETKLKQAEEIDIALPQEDKKADDLAQDLVLGSQFLPLQSMQRLDLDSELSDLSDNLTPSTRQEKQKKVDVGVNIITEPEGSDGNVKNFGQNNIKPDMVHRVVAPVVEMLRSEIQATKDINDHLSNSKELIEDSSSGSKSFVIQLDGDKRTVISFKEIASQQLENIPHRNDQVRMAVETAANNGYSKIILQMHPESLGTIDIAIEFNKEKVVSIQFRAENRNTSELLAKDCPVLERELSKVVNIDSDTSLSFDFKGDNSDNSSHQTPEQNKRNILSTHLMLQEDTNSKAKPIKNGYGGRLSADSVDIKV
ncbi:Putative flagellar hook-length control protein FliK [Candidatus Trichorickettsia mobilis]|uniref:Flagellar hook-length control protein FliK n=1 Tax=Candidatus Trichorickettsia mobilis TaxID=1346319 RepID=A0ABZ0UXG0_9RICK|nr:flagellar hook-length control protein FliK [Candidatus Trichorickettsia mobilis]WPY01327.1 Putative flagellar hook-length control protein FliK [Candidatus Trichorickettsia mobilis]